MTIYSKKIKKSLQQLSMMLIFLFYISCTRFYCLSVYNTLWLCCIQEVLYGNFKLLLNGWVISILIMLLNNIYFCVELIVSNTIQNKYKYYTQKNVVIPSTKCTSEMWLGLPDLCISLRFLQSVNELGFCCVILKHVIIIVSFVI